jgi:polysaccharide export outer membrane protein
MKKVINAACLVVLVCVTTGTWAQNNTGTNSAPKAALPDKQPATAPVPDAQKSVSTGGAPSDYIIGADDVLRISVWKETEMEVTLPVRPDGKISIPLLDDVQAAGLTPMQLGGSIREKLKKFIADPRVTVVVTAMNSQRIYVLGEVLHTGPMTLMPHMTVLQALSTAGFTQFANTKGIYLLRTENGQQTKTKFNYKEAIKGNGNQQNIVLKPGDTLVVP